MLMTPPARCDHSRVKQRRTPMILGTTALVVEEEYLIALEVQRVLESAGSAVTLGALGSIESIVGDRNARFDLAIIAVPPDRPEIVALSRALAARGIAVVILSSSLDQDGLGNLEGLRIVAKPFSDHELLKAAEEAVSGLRPPDKD